jgi:hypothetical protein
MTIRLNDYQWLLRLHVPAPGASLWTLELGDTPQEQAAWRQADRKWLSLWNRGFFAEGKKELNTLLSDLLQEEIRSRE